MDKRITSEPILKNSGASTELSENGYAIFPLLNPSDTQKLINYYNQFQKEEPQNFYASSHSPDFEFRQKTSDFIKQIIEPLVRNVLVNYKLLGGAFVVKPANGRGILQAHQDWNLVDEEKDNSYNLWIPLMDVNENNGAVFVLPGSQSKTHYIRGPHIPSVFKNIEQELWKYLKPLVMKSGEALLYNHALLHGSPPNNTAVNRLGIVIGVAPKNAELQLYANDKGIIKCYHCNESFFLSKNPLSDFESLPLKTIIGEPQNAITLKEFEEIFKLQKPGKMPHIAETTVSGDQRTFLEKYTFTNILAEIKYRLFKTQNTGQSNIPEQELTPTKKDVAKFYDEQTDNFLKVYGNVIQAFRTKDVTVLLNYQMEAMGMKESMKVLDAGCGVCGPAIHFAQHAGVTIEAITISQVQEQKAKAAIEKNKLSHKIKVTCGDYHLLESYYPPETFDVIYFLESFGHAHNHVQVLDSAWKVLKPGGMIYIKDLFRKKTNRADIEKGIETEIQNINTSYHYNVPELNKILDHVRANGYILSSLKTIDIPLQDFENLTISNQFQELTGINKIENLREYIFPVDFFELKLIKPTFDPGNGNSRYFLQNMYFMQIENWKENEL